MPADGPHTGCYQGAPGAYSEAAAYALLGDDATLLPRRTLADVFAAVGGGAARYGIVPVENCLTGAVPDAIDLLAAHAFEVTAETRVHIDHALIGPRGARLGGIRRVLSHPVALAQCRAFFDSHPEIDAQPAFDTAGAVSLALADPERRTAALASRRAADLYAGTVIVEHVQDHHENWTRFLLICADGGRSPRGTDLTGPSRCLIIFELPHEPGALVRALQPLEALDVNLTRIESRPIHGRPFEYRFIAELSASTGARMDDAVGAMRVRAASMRVLGHYPLKARPAA